jgi:hypothetical protein
MLVSVSLSVNHTLFIMNPAAVWSRLYHHHDGICCDRVTEGSLAVFNLYCPGVPHCFCSLPAVPMPLPNSMKVLSKKCILLSTRPQMPTMMHLSFHLHRLLLRPMLVFSVASLPETFLTLVNVRRTDSSLCPLILGFNLVRTKSFLDTLLTSKSSPFTGFGPSACATIISFTIGTSDVSA